MPFQKGPCGEGEEMRGFLLPLRTSRGGSCGMDFSIECFHLAGI